jgi:hypothetical protein
VIVSEIGVEMDCFASAGNPISWAGLCPKNDESAGKRRYNRLKAGAPWLKTTLVQCAWGAARSKGTYLHAQYIRIRARRGNKKASCVLNAHHMVQPNPLQGRAKRGVVAVARICQHHTLRNARGDGRRIVQLRPTD